MVRMPLAFGWLFGFVVVASGCASAPPPAPTKLSNTLATSESHSLDPAYNPQGSDEFRMAVSERKEAAAAAPVVQSMRADDSVKKSKARVHPAAP